MRFLLALGKKDSDLKLWRNSLKSNGFNVSEVVVSLIKAEINNQTANIPNFEILSGDVPNNTMQINLNINDDVAEKALSRIGDYQKAAYIKSLIRRSFIVSAQDRAIRDGVSQITISNTEKEKRTKKPRNKAIAKKPKAIVEPKIVHTSSVIIEEEDDYYDNAVGEEQAFEPTDSTLDMFAALAGE